jgi:hypothetical protein
VKKLVSGGQTGVDRAALDAADELGIEWGGWAPLFWRAEGDAIPAKYREKMRECQEPGYRERTKRNVHDSDATLILTRGFLTGGTRLTVNEAVALGRDHLILDLSLRPDQQAIWMVRAFFGTHDAVNVAGPRESKCPGIYAQAKALLLEALREFAAQAEIA